MNNLKRYNRNLKTLLAVGGLEAGTASMTRMLATKQNRMHFILGSISYLRKWDFDGISLDFMYPGSGKSPPEDKQRFTQLCKVRWARTVVLELVLTLKF